MADKSDKTSGKLGPNPDKMGTDLYPGFSNTVPRGFGRIRRLETGSQRLQRSQYIPVQGNYTRLPSNILHTKVNGQQVIDVSKVYVRKIGGTSVSGNTAGFAFTSTANSITWYWDGTHGSLIPVINRADGSRFTVPTAGSGLTVTGLLGATTYYFLPFWNINNLCNIGWVPGTVGTPQIAFTVADTTDPVNNPSYLMQQTSQGNEALTTAYMTATTGSSGGAGGGGGGGSGCVMSGTEVIPLGDSTASLEVLPENWWVHLRVEDGRDLYCTYNHPLYHAHSGRIQADRLTVGEMIITDAGEQKIVTAEFKKRVCSKYRVHIPKGHLYWANGFLSHNFKPF